MTETNELYLAKVFNFTQKLSQKGDALNKINRTEKQIYYPYQTDN